MANEILDDIAAQSRGNASATGGQNFAGWNYIL